MDRIVFIIRYAFFKYSIEYLSSYMRDIDMVFAIKFIYPKSFRVRFCGVRHRKLAFRVKNFRLLNHLCLFVRFLECSIA